MRNRKSSRKYPHMKNIRLGRAKTCWTHRFPLCVKKARKKCEGDKIMINFAQYHLMVINYRRKNIFDTTIRFECGYKKWKLRSSSSCKLASILKEFCGKNRLYGIRIGANTNSNGALKEEEEEISRSLGAIVGGEWRAGVNVVGDGARGNWFGTIERRRMLEWWWRRRRRRMGRACN